MGTVLFVRLDDGAGVSIAIPSLLPYDRYAADVASRANLYLDRGGAAALLERVLPHVMPHEPKSLAADLATTASLVASSYRATSASVTFSIPLRSRSFEAAPACLYIVGDTVALGIAGNAELVARAKASQIHVLCYRMGFWEEESDEWRGDCISLLFRQEQRMLTIGVGGDLSPEVSDLWRGPTPTGPAPQYLIEPAGLMKLLDVLRMPTKR
jgi:hypothetical protein